MNFIPIEKTTTEDFDFIMITGDAYVDSPSFGHAIIARFVESRGFSVGIIPQPVSHADYKKLGTPKYSFLVSSGVVDSMVNNYTASKKRRTDDEYSPGNKAGRRPDRATIVYSQTLKKLFPESFVIIGGIEASLRRFSHYDYWADTVMPSVLFDSGADLLIYGQGEGAFADIFERLNSGFPIEKIKDVRGTCYLSSFDSLNGKIKDALVKKNDDFIFLKGFPVVSTDKTWYAKSFKIQSENQDAHTGKGLVEEQPGKMFLVQNPPQFPLSTAMLDEIYSLPYRRVPHPIYDAMGGVKANEEVKFSITSHRGCYGSCSFCALTYHNGRVITNRSHENIIKEVEELTQFDDFKGYINDLGGATANFREPACAKQKKLGVCKDRFCIGHNPCPALEVDHSDYLELLRKVRKIPRVKKVFIRSGVRFDYVMMDKNPQFLEELVKYHVSGQLKTAPEHASNNVLKYMNKPSIDVYKNFSQKFADIAKKNNLKEYIVPYFISSHPGSTIKDALELTQYLKSINYMPLQVQDFIPTPSTRSTCMYYTGIDPLTGEKVHVPTGEEKQIQRAFLQYRKKENFPLIRQGLISIGRADLIGSAPHCIVPADATEGIIPRKIQRDDKNTFKKLKAERMGKKGRSGKGNGNGNGKGAYSKFDKKGK
ncbi:MAG: YgiQ family radical SAM protein [Bacillota bacterium]